VERSEAIKNWNILKETNQNKILENISSAAKINRKALFSVTSMGSDSSQVSNITTSDDNSPTSENRQSIPQSTPKPSANGSGLQLAITDAQLLACSAKYVNLLLEEELQERANRSKVTASPLTRLVTATSVISTHLMCSEIGIKGEALAQLTENLEYLDIIIEEFYDQNCKPRDSADFRNRMQIFDTLKPIKSTKIHSYLLRKHNSELEKVTTKN
jgi:hypothetical protein